jgi:hypothetical protein
MKTAIDLAVQLLSPVFYLLLLAGAALGLVIGVMLLLDNARVVRWNEAFSRWFSTSDALRPLDEPRDIRRPLYRWHRVLGVVLFAGALYTLDVLIFRYERAGLVAAFRGAGNPFVLGIVFDTLRIALIAGNVLALAAALIVAFRPSLLKGVEAWTDRYYSGRAVSETLESMHHAPDNYSRARPRIVGLLLAIGSVYVLVALGRALL